MWLKNVWTPGLTKTRTFGDLIASTIGVNSEPQFLSHRLRTEDRFLIIASNGLWEMISTKEAVRIVAKISTKESQEEQFHPSDGSGLSQQGAGAP